MSGVTSAVITGTGRYLPERIVTNEELSRTVATDDEWIRSRTGIGERRIAAAGVEVTSDMAAMAARRALEKAGLEPQDVDLIVVATTTPDYKGFPATAGLVAKQLGAVDLAAFDISLACAGFVAALSTTTQFVRGGGAKVALAIGAETMSSILNWSDRNTCVLFGDAAGAAVVQVGSAGTRGGEVIYHSLGIRADEEVLLIPAGGSRTLLTPEHVVDGKHFVHMRGRETYRFAVSTMASEVEKAAAALSIEVGDFDWIVPHQVNQRIIEAAMSRLGIPMDRVKINIDRFGNTAAASIPVALDEAVDEGRFQPGHLICMPAFGGGLAWGTAVLRWS